MFPEGDGASCCEYEVDPKRKAMQTKRRTRFIGRRVEKMKGSIGKANRSTSDAACLNDHAPKKPNCQCQQLFLAKVNLSLLDCIRDEFVRERTKKRATRISHFFDHGDGRIMTIGARYFDQTSFSEELNFVRDVAAAYS